MTEPMVALMTTAEVAALQPFDAEPLAIVRRGTPHHLVFSVDAPLSSRRRYGLAGTAGCMSIRKAGFGPLVR